MIRRLIARLFRATSDEPRPPLYCSPTFPRGEHGQLIGDLGMWGDSIVCLRCGRERYSEEWTREEVARTDTNWWNRREEVWAQVEAARRLPYGLHSKIHDPD
jgi:hypothetical protein